MLKVSFIQNGLLIAQEDNTPIIEISNDGNVHFPEQNVMFGKDGSMTLPYGGMDKYGNWTFANAKINSDGSAEFNGQAFRLNADGSGQMANGNITWDAEGNMNVNSIQ